MTKKVTETIKYQHASGEVSIITPLTASLIETIDNIREEKKLSLADVEKLTGTTKSQLSKLFNFKINVSVNKMLDILDALGYEIKVVPKHKKTELQD